MDESVVDVLNGGKIESHQTQLVIEKLRDQVRKSPLFSGDKPLEKRVQEAREVLANEPYFLLENYSVLSSKGLRLVPTERIVGGVSPSFSRWGNEYQGRRGRHETVIGELISAAQAEDTQQFSGASEHIFHLSDGRPSERIKLLSFDGPKGPVYFIEDGTHRVSACKAIEFESIPCDVESCVVREDSSTKLSDKLWWEDLIKTGLVRGTVEEGELDSGSGIKQKMYTLKIEQSVLPWVNLSPRQFFRLNQRYNEIYPGAFSRVYSASEQPSQLPEAIFLDEVEFNKYLRQKLFSVH